MYYEHYLLFLLIILFLIPFSISISTTTISQKQKIKDGDQLVSKEGAFVLGFFSPGNSSNRYVGIWYNKIPEQTIVWVANRENPINVSTGVLFIDMEGNLVIHGLDPNTPVWSTNITVPSRGNSTSFARLMDTGNLVLLQGDANNQVVVWQSFDYPTHTLLPYMKLGIDLKTGLNRYITSWKSLDDPGKGGYSYKMDIKGSPPQTFLYRGQDLVLRAGPWNGKRLSGIPQMTQNFIFKITYAENSSEVYIMYNLVDASVFSRMIIHESGVLKRLTWHADRSQWVEFWSAPKEQCDFYNHCGPYGNCDSTNAAEFECQCLPGYKPKSSWDWYLRDGSDGCVAKHGVNNTCREGDGFVKVTDVKLPDTKVGYVNRSIGLKECEVECLKNCSCKGYSSADVSSSEGSGCIIWHGELTDTRLFSSGGQDFYLRVDAAELAEYQKSQHSKGRKSILAYILAPVVAVFIVLICLALCLVKRKGTEKQGFLLNPNFSTTSLASSCDKLRDSSGPISDLPQVDLNTIIRATDDFSNANKLGRGGFGTVYKALFPNGQEVAVKRLAKSSGQGGEEFKNEVTLIAKLQHRNLVRLLGFCVHKEEKMLIYEYLPNKGLDLYLFEKSNKGSLTDWKKRHDIIMGIARGLLYLHQDSRLRIIHRDLKASNVLLDASMNPKISDFGMARIFGGDQIEANTNRVVGTYGYMAPEYAMEGLFSIKSDVFSFGVLLLEIISGTRSSSYYIDSSVNLIGHVWNLWKEDKGLEAVDPVLDNSSYSTHEVLRCIQIGLLCVQEQAVDRPTMSDVAFMLSHETELSFPNQPAFVLKAGQQYSSSASVGESSGNNLTITGVEGR